jgi:hypothetical protein
MPCKSLPKILKNPTTTDHFHISLLSFMTTPESFLKAKRQWMRPPKTPAISTRVYEIRPRSDKRGVDLISDALPFGRLWYGEQDASLAGSKKATTLRWKNCLLAQNSPYRDGRGEHPSFLHKFLHTAPDFPSRSIENALQTQRTKTPSDHDNAGYSPGHH